MWYLRVGYLSRFWDMGNSLPRIGVQNRRVLKISLPICQTPRKSTPWKKTLSPFLVSEIDNSPSNLMWRKVCFPKDIVSSFLGCINCLEITVVELGLCWRIPIYKTAPSYVYFKRYRQRHGACGIWKGVVSLGFEEEGLLVTKVGGQGCQKQRLLFKRRLRRQKVL